MTTIEEFEEIQKSQQKLLEGLKQCYNKSNASDMECIVCREPARKIVEDKHSEDTNYFCQLHFEGLDDA